MFKKVLMVALLVTSCVNAKLTNIEVSTNNDNSKNLVVDGWVLEDSNNTKTAYEYTENGWNIVDSDINKICDVKDKKDFNLLTLNMNENKNKQSTTDLILSNISNIVKKTIVKEATKKIANLILSNDNNNINTVVNYTTKAVDLFTGTKYNKVLNDAKKPSIFNYFWKSKAQKQVEKSIGNILTIGINYCMKQVL